MTWQNHIAVIVPGHCELFIWLCCAFVLFVSFRWTFRMCQRKNYCRLMCDNWIFRIYFCRKINLSLCHPIKIVYCLNAGCVEHCIKFRLFLCVDFLAFQFNSVVMWPKISSILTSIFAYNHIDFDGFISMRLTYFHSFCHILLALWVIFTGNFCGLKCAVYDVLWSYSYSVSPRGCAHS